MVNGNLKISRSFRNTLKFHFSKIYKYIRLFRSKNITIPILCYHSVSDCINYEADSISISDFESHIKFLKENYNVISLEKAFNFIENQKIDIENPVVITFDDGYIDNYHSAFPILKNFNAHATIFLVSNFINNKIKLIDDKNFEPMSWEHIIEMDQSENINFGAHSHNHPILSSLDDDAVIDEISLSKKIIEEKLQHPIKMFAYPNGQEADIPSAAINYINQNDFSLACSTLWKTNHKFSEKYILSRVMISGDDNLENLKSKVDGDYDFIYWIQKIKYLLSKVFHIRSDGY